uniref:hypothetical protein n=1 Tax=Paenibacillus alkalitolerans TaxID=2799335 RepID=UPI001F2F4682
SVRVRECKRRYPKVMHHVEEGFSRMEFLKDLCINILGVLIGGLIAYRIARWQFEANETFESRKNQTLLRENINRITEELRKNLGIIIELKGVLNKNENSKNDILHILEWGMTYVDSFSFFSFKHLSNSYLSTLLPTSLERYIFDSYNELENLKNWYKQTSKAHSFYLGFQGSQEAANNEFSTIKMNINQIRNKLESNIKQIEEFKV